MKTQYNGINFDSELEVEYYKYLQENNIKFKYQNEYSKNPIKIDLGRRKTYTPDFITYDDTNRIITIIETKGYAKWSANEDNNIMDFMTNQVKTNPEFIIAWLKEINAYKDNYSVAYRRIRYNKIYGWVDYKFKSPNTLANKRKEKIKLLEAENKELIKFKKDTIKYFKLCELKLDNPKKATKSQNEFMNQYISNLEKELNNGTK